jgi:hypothetical protein
MANEFNIKNGFISNGDSSISGRLTTEKLTITSGATNGYVLTSDASGNGTWQSSPVTGDTNIYNSDGTLTGDRILSGDSHSLLFSDLTTMDYTLAPGSGINGYSINIDRTGMSGAIGSRLLRITETSTGNELFGIHRDGYVKISNAYNMPTTSGAIGDVLTQVGGNNVVWQTPFPQWSAITTNVSSSDITTIINSGGTISILSAPPSGYTYDWNGVVKYNYGTTPYNNSGGGVWVIRQGTDEMAYGFNLNAVSNDLLWHVYPGAGSASVITQNYDQGLSIGIVSGPITVGDGDIVVKLTYRLIQI